MTEKQRALWEAIRRFSFDETIEEYGFETRLAYENKWTHYVTKQAIEEYKKFMFLASISNQMVSPSEIVDTVWHQHLIFSKSYERLCQITGKKIEHIPSTHNPHNHSVFKTAKEHTTTLYELYFGKQNPYFWDNHYLEKTQITTDNTALRRRIIKIACISVLLYLPLYFLLKPLIVTIESKVFILFTIIVELVLFIVLKFQIESIIDNQAGELCNEDMHFQNLNTAEVLCLKSGNNHEYVHAVVNTMIKEDKIHFSSDYAISLNEEIKLESESETAVANVFLEKGVRNYVALFNHLKYKSIFAIPDQAMQLLKKRWLNNPQFIKSISMLILILLPMFYFLLIRLKTGLERDKSVIFLLIGIAMYLRIAWYFLKELCNGLFQSALPELYVQKIKSNERADLKEGYEWQYLVLGTVMYTLHFNQMVNHVNHNSAKSDSSSGCGTSCGTSCGSSCGGGCGGCGGGD